MRALLLWGFALAACSARALPFPNDAVATTLPDGAIALADGALALPDSALANDLNAVGVVTPPDAQPAAADASVPADAAPPALLDFALSDLSPEPSDLSGIAPVAWASVATGEYLACGLTTTGGVKCWGDNSVGTLGNNSMRNSAVPVDVVGLDSGVTSLSLFYHACAVSAGGAVCWGHGEYGQLGDNSTDNSPVPITVLGLGANIAAVSTDDGIGCALSTAGGVKCWGDGPNNSDGDGTGMATLVPTAVSGLGSGVAAIFSTCAVTTSGALECWGDNWAGEYGNGNTTQSLVPVGVFGLTAGVSSACVNDGNICVLLANGTVECAGVNSEGELGNGSFVDSTVPVAVSGITDATMLSCGAGGSTACVVTAGGGVKCWGDNSRGQLGNGTTTNSATPVDVTGLTSGALNVSTGWYNSCAVTTSHGLKCWGDNSAGQLGNNTTINSLVPVDVAP